MRILMLNPFFYPYHGGTEKFIYNVGKRLAKKHEVFVLTSRHKKNLKKREEIEGINVIRLDAKIIWDSPSFLPPPFPIFLGLSGKIKQLVNELKIDVIHINNRLIYTIKDFVSLPFTFPLTLTIHNSTPKNIGFIEDTFGGLLDRTITRMLFYRTHGISGVSKRALMDTIPEDYKGVKMVTYNGVDVKIFRPKKVEEWKGIEKDKPIVLSIARFVPQKRLDTLIEAMEGINATLILFGRGPLKKKLLSLAREKNVELKMIDEWLSEEELVELINFADLFVLPSSYEPFGIAIAEAMACGKAVIGSDAGGIPEVVGKAGLIFPAGDIIELRKCITKLLADEKLRKELGKKARKRILAKFTWEKTAERIEKFFRKSIEKAEDPSFYPKLLSLLFSKNGLWK